MISIETTTTNGVSSASVASGMPVNTPAMTAFGDSEIKAAINLCRKLIEAGVDPETVMSIPVVPLIYTLQLAA
jgi:hypothetical protein